MDACGDVLVVGAPSEVSDAVGIDGDQTEVSMSNAGAAYAIVRGASGNWSQRAYVKASNTGAEEYW